jgi:hypothetical protein
MESEARVLEEQEDRDQKLIGGIFPPDPVIEYYKKDLGSNTFPGEPQADRYRAIRKGKGPAAVRR